MTDTPAGPDATAPDGMSGWSTVHRYEDCSWTKGCKNCRHKFINRDSDDDRCDWCSRPVDAPAHAAGGPAPTPVEDDGDRELLHAQIVASAYEVTGSFPLAHRIAEPWLPSGLASDPIHSGQTDAVDTAYIRRLPHKAQGAYVELLCAALDQARAERARFRLAWFSARRGRDGCVMELRALERERDEARAVSENRSRLNVAQVRIAAEALDRALRAERERDEARAEMARISSLTARLDSALDYGAPEDENGERWTPLGPVGEFLDAYFEREGDAKPAGNFAGPDAVDTAGIRALIDKHGPPLSPMLIFTLCDALDQARAEVERLTGYASPDLTAHIVELTRERDEARAELERAVDAGAGPHLCQYRDRAERAEARAENGRLDDEANEGLGRALTEARAALARVAALADEMFQFDPGGAWAQKFRDAIAGGAS